METIGLLEMAKRFTPQVVLITPDRKTTWDAREAIRLEIVADGMVEEHGSCGLDPLIQEAAAECVLAHQRQDIDTVQECCRRIENRARTLSNGISRAA